MTEPAKCHCGSISWERNIEENRYICASCKRPLWQPIETAPQDEMILVWAEDWGGSVAELVLMSEYASYDPDEYEDEKARMWVGDQGLNLVFDPTHWMPLPEGPKE